MASDSEFINFHHAHRHVSAARHLPPRAEPYDLPRPIILDSDLRCSTTCKLLINYRAGNGRRPWVVCNDVFSEEKQQRKKKLEEAGARVLHVSGTRSHYQRKSTRN